MTMGNISAVPHSREIHTEVAAAHNAIADIDRLLSHQKIANFADALSSFFTEHAKHQKHLRKHRQPRRWQREHGNRDSDAISKAILTDLTVITEERGMREAQPSQKQKDRGGRHAPNDAVTHDNEDNDDEDGYDDGRYRETRARGPQRSPRQRRPATGYGNPGFPEDGRGPAPRGYSNNRRPVRPRRSRDPEEAYRSTHPENEVRNVRMSPRRQTSRRQDYPSYTRGEETNRGRTEWANPHERGEEPESGGMDWADVEDRPSADPLGEDNISPSGRRTRLR